MHRYGGAVRLADTADLDSADPAPLIIMNQDDYNAFVIRLPANDVAKTGNSGANPDPLSHGVAFDWSRYMLLVVFDSQTLSFPPNVNRVEIQKGNLLAYVEYPDTKGMIEAIPRGYGAYGAALVLKNDLPLTWNNPGHKVQEARHHSMMMFLPNSQ